MKTARSVATLVVVSAILVVPLFTHAAGGTSSSERVFDRIARGAHRVGGDLASFFERSLSSLRAQTSSVAKGVVKPWSSLASSKQAPSLDGVEIEKSVGAIDSVLSALVASRRATPTSTKTEKVANTPSVPLVSKAQTVVTDLRPIENKLLVLQGSIEGLSKLISNRGVGGPDATSLAEQQTFFAPQEPTVLYDKKIGELRSELMSVIANVDRSATQRVVYVGQAVAAAASSDRLNGSTLVNGKVEGTFTGLTAGMIPTDIVASNYLALAGGTLSGTTTGTTGLFALFGIGTTSPSASLAVAGTLAVTGTTTLNGQQLLFPSNTGSNGEVLSTNGAGGLSWVAAGAGSQTPWSQDIDGGGYDLSGVGTTTTTHLSVSSSSTLTNFTASNATITNATSTSFFASILSATNAILSSLSGTTLVYTNATFTGATTTNAYVTDTLTVGGNATTSNSGDFATKGTLDVSGTATSTFIAGIQTAALDITGNATSTFTNGIQLASGCFRLPDGTCAGSGGGATTLDALTDVTIASPAYGNLLGYDGAGWVKWATSTLGIALSDTTGTLATARGGTGLTSYTPGDLLYASDATTIAGTSTANLKSSLSINNVENTALSTWAGTGNITTLGTITTGTWNAGALTSSGALSITNLSTLLGGASTTIASFSGPIWVGGNATTSANGDIDTKGSLTTVGTINGATLTGGSLSATAVNGVTSANILVSSGTYANPDWLTSLASSKITGLGTLATQNSSDVNITGGNIFTTNSSSTNATTTYLEVTGVASTTRFIVSGNSSLTNASSSLLTVSNTLYLPKTSASAGGLFVENQRFLNTYGTDNVLLGNSSGNLTQSGSGNVGIGSNTLSALTGGTWNVAIGLSAMQSNSLGGNNVAIGYNASAYNTLGSQNVAIGSEALRNNYEGINNTAIGYNALLYTRESYNSALGMYAGSDVGGTNFNQTGTYNTYLGYRASQGIDYTNALSYSTAIGAFSKVGASNAMALGGTGAYAVSVGISTSTPYSKLSIWSNGTDTGARVFEITDQASTTQFSINDRGAVSAGTTTVTNLIVANTSTSTLTGGIDVFAINQTGNATSTFTNGIQLASGCFRLPDGTCAGSGGGATTLDALTDVTISGPAYGNLLGYDGAGWVKWATTTLGLTNSDITGLGSIATQGADNVNIAGGSAIFGEATSTNLYITGALSMGVLNTNGNGIYMQDGIIRNVAEQTFIISAEAGGSELRLKASDQDVVSIFGTGGVKQVGIGTTTPYAGTTLQVANNGASRMTLTDTSAGLDLKHWFTESAGGVFSLGTTSDMLAITDTFRPFSVASTGFGTTTLSGLSISGYATSTANTGFNITSGCYAVNGTCVGGGGGVGTVTSVSAGAGLAGGPITDTGTLTLDVGYANTWTATQTFGKGVFTYASTTQIDITEANATTTIAGSLNVRNGLFTISSYGKVGINTVDPDPTFAMTVGGSILAKGLELTGESTNPSDGPGFYARDGGAYFQAGSGRNIIFTQSNPDNPFLTVLSSNGNVGVGTSTPLSKLSVFGDIMVENGNGVKFAQPWVTSAFSFILKATTTAMAGDVTMFLPEADGTTGQALLTNGSGSTYWGSVGGGTPGAGDTLIQYNNGGSFAAATGVAFAGGNLLIDTASAKLGIGSTTPYSSLALQASNPNDPSIFGISAPNGQTSILNISMLNDGGAANMTLGMQGQAVDALTLYGSLAVNQGANATTSIDAGGFTVAGTGLIYQGTTGNLGIGVDPNANARMTVASTGALNSIFVSDDTRGFIALAAGGGGNIRYLGVNSNDDLFVANNSQVPTVTFKNTGAVGIGTTTPNGVLNVAGSNGGILTLTHNGIAENLKHWRAVSANGSFLVQTIADSLEVSTISNKLSITTGGLLSFTLASSSQQSILSKLYIGGTSTTTLVGDGGTSVFNSNLSVGTSSAYAKLTVWGQATSTEPVQRIFEVTDNASTTLFSIDTSGTTTISNLALGAMQFEDDAGVISWANMPSSTTTANMLLGYTGQIADNDIFGIYASTTGTSGVADNLKMVIGTTSSGYLGYDSGATIPLIVSNGAICVDNGGTASCSTAARMAAGVISADSSQISGADLAENYPTGDASLEAGELLMIDKTNSIFVSRYDMTASGTPVLVGVVSSAPGVTIGSRENPEADTARWLPVALSGRVPVKVNLEGGNIAIGDYITVSSVAGIGTKATTSGQTVGIALESYAGEPEKEGKITVFVNLGYQKLSDAIAEGSVASGWIIDQESGNMKLASSTALDLDGKDILNVGKILAKNGSWSIGENGNLQVAELEVGTTEKPMGITLYDEDTGSPYCLSIKGGMAKTRSGKCSYTPASNPADTAVASPEVAVSTPSVSESTTTESTATTTDVMESEPVDTPLIDTQATEEPITETENASTTTTDEN